MVFVSNGYAYLSEIIFQPWKIIYYELLINLTDQHHLTPRQLFFFPGLSKFKIRLLFQQDKQTLKNET